MNNIPLIIDISIVCIVLTFAIIGIVKGFVRTIFDFFHSAASAAIAYLLTPTVTGFIKKTEIYESLVEKAKNSFYDTIKGFLENDPEKLLSDSADVNAFFERFFDISNGEI